MGVRYVFVWVKTSLEQRRVSTSIHKFPMILVSKKECVPEVSSCPFVEKWLRKPAVWHVLHRGPQLHLFLKILYVQKAFRGEAHHTVTAAGIGAAYLGAKLGCNELMVFNGMEKLNGMEATRCLPLWQPTLNCVSLHSRLQIDAH
eukprot:1151097-Pelagomonas_calceolata.AAC.6